MKLGAFLCIDSGVQPEWKDKTVLQKHRSKWFLPWFQWVNTTCPERLTKNTGNWHEVWFNEFKNLWWKNTRDERKRTQRVLFLILPGSDALSFQMMLSRLWFLRFTSLSRDRSHILHLPSILLLLMRDCQRKFRFRTNFLLNHSQFSFLLIYGFTPCWI